MTDSLEVIKTKKLVCLLTLSKEKEMSSYKHKVLELKKIKAQNPKSAVNEFKYNLAKMRYNQLKRTTQNLKNLEEEIKNLNISLGIFEHI